MPIWLRNFTFNKIREHYSEKNKQNSGTSTNDLEQGRDILRKAQQSDPSNAQKHRYMDKFPKSTTKPTISTKVPDFVTTKATKV
tara:strand:- start:1285 stop:1536 length:252 start_codon:yes stop_codon:yes gene_type:complete